MTKLGCSVDTCSYNQQHLCSLNSIKVGGTSASTSSETCCDSFVDKSSNGFTNSVGSAELETDIGCDATNCCYNESKCCRAECIEVNGECACDCHETECQTFKPE